MRNLGIAALLVVFAVLIAAPLTFAEKDRPSLRPPAKDDSKSQGEDKTSLEKLVFESIPAGFPLQLKWPFYSKKLGKTVAVWYIPRAEYFIDASNSAPIDGTYFVQTEKNVLCALSEEGALMWTSALKFRLTHGPRVTAFAVYLSNLSTILCLDRRSGQLLWAKDYELAISTPPHVTSAKLYVGTVNKLLVAIDRLTGDINWTATLDGDINAAPTDCFMPRPADYVLVPSTDGYVYAYSNSGKLLWKFKTYGMVLATPATETVGEEKFMYFGSQDTNLYCVNTISSQKMWEFRCGTPISKAPILGKDTVYFQDDRGVFYAVNKETGELKWKNNKYNTIVGVTIAGDIYCLSGRNTIAAVNPATGAERWSHELPGFAHFLTNAGDSNVIGITNNGLVLVFTEPTK